MIMVDFPRQLKLEAVSSEQEPSFGSGFEAGTPNDSTQKDDTKPSSSNSPDNLSVGKEVSAPTSFSAVNMLSDRYPSFVASNNNQRSKNESRYVLTVLLLITALVLSAWAVWDPRYFHSDSDLVYDMGL